MTAEITHQTDQHRWRRQRSLAVIKGAGFGLVARVISVSCTLIQVPISLKYLGVEGFGLWMTLTSIGGLATAADFGFGLGAKTLLAQQYGRDDLSGMRALMREGLRITSLLGVSLGAIALAFVWALDWRTLLRVTSPQLGAQLPWALGFLTLSVGLSLPLSLGASLASAMQLTWVQNVIAALGGLLTLLLVALLTYLQTSWLVLVATILMLPLLMNAVLFTWMHYRLVSKEQAPRSLDASQAREFRVLSLWFFIPQAGALYTTLSIPVLISLIVGPAAVTAYNLLQRIFGLVGQAHWMTLSALWPAYSEAMERDDHTWIRKAYYLSWQATLALFVPGLALLAALTPWLVLHWVGQFPENLTQGLIWTSALFFGLQLVGQPPALILNGLGRVRGPALFGMVGHLLSLGGMLIGGKIAGAPGVVAGMLSGYVLVGLPALLIQAHNTIRNL